VTKADVTERRLGSAASTDETAGRGGLLQTVVVVAVVLVAGGSGYALRKSALEQDAGAPVAAAAPDGVPAAPASPLGDLSAFRTITQDTLNLVNAGNQSGASTRITDLETAWDNGEARLKPKDKAAWTEIDGKIDTVLREVRSTSPNPGREKNALTTLVGALGQPASTGAPTAGQQHRVAPPARFPRLGDLSAFRTITQDTLKLVNAGNQSGASTRITDLETAWDNGEARLKPKDKAAWTEIDSKIDTVLRAVRSTSPDPAAEKTALTALLTELS
jgi:hypothetical protein